MNPCFYNPIHLTQIRPNLEPYDGTSLPVFPSRSLPYAVSTNFLSLTYCASYFISATPVRIPNPVREGEPERSRLLSLHDILPKIGFYLLFSLFGPPLTDSADESAKIL